jgi:hypothetical protein
VIHAGCPDAVETIKWSRPFFDYHGPLCGIAAFKAHCTLHFWKGDVLAPDTRPPDERPRDARPRDTRTTKARPTDTPPLEARPRDAMGQLGRITSVADLPARRTLVALVKRAATLNEVGVSAQWQEKRARTRATRAATPVVVPKALADALAKNRKARESFDAFSPSHKREYIEWITGAKREDTRARRLALAVAQIAEGKSQNWRYEPRR